MSSGRLLATVRRSAASRYQRLHRHFGTAGLVVAIVALVATLGGTAFAAKYIITKTSQIKPNVLSKLKGKEGKRGKEGPAGPQGPAGPAGPAGGQGAKGDPGAKGDAGAKGATGSTGVTGVTGATGTTGVTGATGTTGATGPFMTSLETGKTETGAWATQLPASGAGITAISFPIPLAASLSVLKVKVNSLAVGTGDLETGSTAVKNLTHTANKPPWVKGTPISGTGIPAGTLISEVKPGGTELVLTAAATATSTGVALSSTVFEECDDGVGTASTSEHPEADTGFLCVFVALTEKSGALTEAAAFKAGGSATFNIGASTAGAKLKLEGTAAEDVLGGTFAVTG